MPGIAGIASSGTTDAPTLVHAMESAMHTASAWICEAAESASGKFFASCFARGVADSGRVASHGKKKLVLDGEIYGDAGDSTGQALSLLRRFDEVGIEAFREVEGRFVAAIWCDESERLTLVTDRFASKPVFVLHQQDQFAFCSSINALRAASSTPLLHNHRGLVQFFSFGHLWNDDTFYESITAAAPASCFEFNTTTGELSKTQYWRPGSRQRVASHKESLDEISDALHHSISQQSRCESGLGVALSGGLDARTILGLVDTDHVETTCITYAMDGSLDQRSSQRLAEIAGSRFQPFILDDRFLGHFREHLQRMVDLTDGHYLSQCIMIPTLPLYESLGISALLRGHAGELLHMQKAYNFSVDRAFSQVRTRDDLEHWLTPRLRGHMTEDLAEPLLVGMDRQEFLQVASDSLKASLAETDHLEQPLDKLSQLFLDQRTRRETAMSMVKFTSVLEPRLPYLNSRLIEAVFACDPDLRVGETIQSYALRRFRPEFLRPINSNTGAPVGAPPWYRQLAYYRMRVLAKLGVKGYQPYERLGLWLRRELKPIVEDILLDERCLDRGILNPNCVRGVIARHAEMKQNHTYLILAMMAAELGLRRADDRPADAAEEKVTSAI